MSKIVRSTLNMYFYFCCQHVCLSRDIAHFNVRSSPEKRKWKYVRKVKKNYTDTALFDPTDEHDEKCPFSFTVHLIKNGNNSLPIIKNKRCLVLKWKRGSSIQSRYHCGHCHIKTKFLNAPTKYMNKDDAELALHCAQLAISSTSVEHLLCTCNHSGYNIDWNPAQIQYLDKKYNSRQIS